MIWLEDGDWRKRLVAVSNLSYGSQTVALEQHVVDQILLLASDTNPSVRRAVASFAAPGHETEQLKILQKLAADPDEWVREKTAFLMKFQTAEVDWLIEFFLDQMDDESPAVVCQAASSISGNRLWPCRSASKNKPKNVSREVWLEKAEQADVEIAARLIKSINASTSLQSQLFKWKLASILDKGSSWLVLASYLKENVRDLHEFLQATANNWLEQSQAETA